MATHVMKVTPISAKSQELSAGQIVGKGKRPDEQ